LNDDQNISEIDPDYIMAIRKAEKLEQFHISGFYTPVHADLKYSLERQAELRRKVYEPDATKDLYEHNLDDESETDTDIETHITIKNTELDQIEQVDQVNQIEKELSETPRPTEEIPIEEISIEEIPREDYPIIEPPETPIEPEETPIVTEEETPFATKEETPIVTEEETPIATEEETPIATEEETILNPDSSSTDLEDHDHSPIRTSQMIKNDLLDNIDTENYGSEIISKNQIDLNFDDESRDYVKDYYTLGDDNIEIISTEETGQPEIKIPEIHSIYSSETTEEDVDSQEISEPIEIFKKNKKKKEIALSSSEEEIPVIKKPPKEPVKSITIDSDEDTTQTNSILIDDDVSDIRPPRALVSPPITKLEALFKGPEDQILTTKFNIEIRRSDIIRLRPNGLLNDEIVNFYMGLLKSREEQNPFLPRCHFFNSFFYDKLSKIRTGYDYQSVGRWTKSIDLFNLDKVIIPIHKENHWCVSVIDFKEKTFSYYDSLGAIDRTCIERLRRYVIDEHQSKKKSHYDLSEWTDYCPGMTIPLQYNGVDCGVFACKYADYISQDKPFNFSQSDIPRIRKKMIEEIYHAQIL